MRCPPDVEAVYDARAGLEMGQTFVDAFYLVPEIFNLMETISKALRHHKYCSQQGYMYEGILDPNFPKLFLLILNICLVLRTVSVTETGR
jgi:hypothetical protein